MSSLDTCSGVPSRGLLGGLAERSHQFRRTLGDVRDRLAALEGVLRDRLEDVILGDDAHQLRTTGAVDDEPADTDDGTDVRPQGDLGGVVLAELLELLHWLCSLVVMITKK